MLRLTVRTGAGAGRSFDAEAEVVRIGRGPGNDLVIEETHVSAEHARVFTGPAEPLLEDLRSTNGPSLVRGDARTALGETGGHKAALAHGHVIELGSGDAVTRIALAVQGQSYH